MMDEAKLLEKLARIEALFAGATTDGERVAAGEAKRRILARLETLAREQPPIEWRFSMNDPWQRRLFMALLRRYDLEPYRYSGQRQTTIMVKAPRRFIDETLWPQFVELSGTLQSYLDEVTQRIICQVVHPNSRDAAARSPPATGSGGGARQQ